MSVISISYCFIKHASDDTPPKVQCPGPKIQVAKPLNNYVAMDFEWSPIKVRNTFCVAIVFKFFIYSLYNLTEFKLQMPCILLACISLIPRRKEILDKSSFEAHHLILMGLT